MFLCVWWVLTSPLKTFPHCLLPQGFSPVWVNGCMLSWFLVLKAFPLHCTCAASPHCGIFCVSKEPMYYWRPSCTGHRWRVSALCGLPGAQKAGFWSWDTFPHSSYTQDFSWEWIHLWTIRPQWQLEFLPHLAHSLSFGSIRTLCYKIHFEFRLKFFLSAFCFFLSWRSLSHSCFSLPSVSPSLAFPIDYLIWHLVLKLL